MGACASTVDMGQAENLPTSGAKRPGPSDERLMEDLGTGDQSALGLLLDRHWADLVGYSFQLLGVKDEAEDVAQEVFVRIWERREDWAPAGSVRGYLYRVARNLILSRLRRDRMRERVEPRIRLQSRRVATPLEDMARVELREAFEEALRPLPDRRREAFLLVRVQGLSLGEAAEAMNVTRRTVANHLYLAATDLERHLEKFLQ